MKQIIRIITQLREWMFLHLLGKDGREIWSRLREVYITNMDPKHYGMIGKHYSLGTEMTSVPTNVFLEDYTRIQNHLNFISYKGKLTVKKYAAIGAGCIIIPGDHVPTVGVPQYLAGRLHINDVDGEIIVGDSVHNLLHVLGILQDVLQPSTVSAMLSHKSAFCLCLHFLRPTGAGYLLPQGQPHSEVNPQDPLSFRLSSSDRWGGCGRTARGCQHHSTAAVRLANKSRRSMPSRRAEF